MQGKATRSGGGGEHLISREIIGKKFGIAERGETLGFADLYRAFAI